MNWFDVDGAREHLTRPGAKRPSRKVVYAMVGDGMKVARSGVRIWFCESWIDEYLESKGTVVKRVVGKARG